jgi:quercetin dioxygenase-like cupin family protein
MMDSDALRARFIPFSGLRYTTEAFIDYRIPGCHPKYNYALIGPGVSQNPNQPVSLREPHGFQVGGVSMPNGKTNPAHMHFTCEVFICVRGDWRVLWGFDPGTRSADLGTLDIVSVPTWIYRGFTNIGVDDGFMFTALGGNDTGGILWGPSTLEAAAREGVLLTEDYRIVDATRGESMPAGVAPLQPMTPEEIGALRTWSPAEMARRIVRFADLRWSSDALLDAALPGCGGALAQVIGLGLSQDRDALAPVANAHGLSIEWLRLPPGGAVSRHRLTDKQVLIAARGDIEIVAEASDGIVRQRVSGSESAWDSFALPADCWRALRNDGDTEALALLLTSGDHRKRIEWDPAVVRAAGGADRAIDANGYVAPKRFVDRSQR